MCMNALPRFWEKWLRKSCGIVQAHSPYTFSSSLQWPHTKRKPAIERATIAKKGKSTKTLQRTSTTKTRKRPERSLHSRCTAYASDARTWFCGERSFENTSPWQHPRNGKCTVYSNGNYIFFSKSCIAVQIASKKQFEKHTMFCVTTAPKRRKCAPSA